MAIATHSGLNFGVGNFWAGNSKTEIIEPRQRVCCRGSDLQRDAEV